MKNEKINLTPGFCRDLPPKDIYQNFTTLKKSHHCNKVRKGEMAEIKKRLFLQLFFWKTVAAS